MNLAEILARGRGVLQRRLSFLIHDRAQQWTGMYVNHRAAKELLGAPELQFETEIGLLTAREEMVCMLEEER